MHYSVGLQTKFGGPERILAHRCFLTGSMLNGNGRRVKLVPQEWQPSGNANRPGRYVDMGDLQISAMVDENIRGPFVGATDLVRWRISPSQ